MGKKQIPEIKHKSVWLILRSILLAMVITGMVQADQPKAEDLLIVALRNDLPPFSFLNMDGHPAGLIADIWKLWAEKTGRDIEFFAADRKTTLAALLRGEVDIIGGLLYSADRYQFMSFSQPFFEITPCFFFTKDQAFPISRDTLSGEKLGIIDQSALEQELHNNYPDIQIIRFSNNDDMIEAARAGKIRAFFGTSESLAIRLNQLGLSSEFESMAEKKFVKKIHAGVLKENEALLSLIDTGFNAISHQELAEIESRWFPDPAQRYYRTTGPLRLTTTEQAWIKNHNSVRIAIPALFLPLMFLEGDRFQGIVPDYLELFSQRTGLRFEAFSAPLADLPMLINARQGDMSPVFMSLTPNPLLSLTDSCFDLNWVIVNRLDGPFFRELNDLKGMKVSVVKDIPIYEQLKHNNSKIEIHPHENPVDAMRSVSQGKTDAFIGSMPIVGYMIQQQRLANLKIAGSAGIEDFELRFAVRSDFPELTGILNKAIRAVTPEEHDAIFRKWLPVRYQHAAEWKTVRQWVFGVGGILGLCLALSLVWNRRLQNEISKRNTVEALLKKESDRFRIAQEISLAAFNILRSVRQPGGAIVDFVWTYANPATTWILKRSPEELVGRRLLETFPGSRENKAVFDRYARIVETGEGDEIEFEYNADGVSSWLRNMAVKLEDGVALSYSDITQRKNAEAILHRSKQELESLVAARTAEINAVNAQLRRENIERQQIEEAWRRNETLLKQTQQLTKVGGWEYDVAAKQLHWTEEIYRIYEVSRDYDPNDIQANIQFYAPEDRALMERAFWQAVDQGQPYHLELKFISFRGTHKWIQMTAQIEHLHNKVIRVFGNMVDVTERKQAEEALLFNETRLEALLHLYQLPIEPITEIADFVLEEQIKLTRSSIGFLILLNSEETIGDIHAWSQSAMAECRVDAKPKQFVIAESGLWGEVVRHRATVMVNDYAAPHPAKKGFPPGHVAIQRYLSIPVFDGQRIVAVAAVANKSEDYNESDVRQLKLLLEGMWGIIRRKQAEESLRASLSEKEVLLREIHHRVKNNLAMIIGLIEMQAAGIPDKANARCFYEIRERIRAIARVHEDLYRSRQLSSINFKKYLENLTDDMLSLHHPPAVAVQTNFSAAFLDIETAIPCGLLFIELLTNALIHAFPAAGAGNQEPAPPSVIRAEFSQHARSFTLAVTDNGVGMPADFDWRKTKSMGLRLVNILSAQIDGQLEISACNGTSVKITFPEKTKSNLLHPTPQRPGTETRPGADGHPT